MKKRINAEAFDKLSDELKKLYKKAEGSDNYVLQIDDDDEDDTASLKRAKDREKARADEAEKRAKEAQKRLDELEEEAEKQRAAAGKGLDEEGLTKLKAKHQKELDDLKGQLTSKDTQLHKLVIDRTAMELATELSTVPTIFAGTVSKQLGIEVGDDGLPVAVVLGPDGKPSGKSLADFKKDLLATPELAPILVASKAAGGGATGGRPGGGATGKKLSEMSATEEATFANEHPEAYAKMLAEG